MAAKWSYTSTASLEPPKTSRHFTPDVSSRQVARTSSSVSPVWTPGSRGCCGTRLKLVMLHRSVFMPRISVLTRCLQSLTALSLSCCGEAAESRSGRAALLARACSPRILGISALNELNLSMNAYRIRLSRTRPSTWPRGSWRTL